MPFLDKNRRATIPNGAIDKWAAGGGSSFSRSIEASGFETRPINYGDIVFPGDGSEVVLDDGTTGLVTPGLTSFAGEVWESHTGELGRVQAPVLPYLAHTQDQWRVYRLDYSAPSSTTVFFPSIPPADDAFGFAVGDSSGGHGRWWTNKGIYYPAEFPAQSADIFLFPKNIAFQSANSGSVFVAVRIGTAAATAFIGVTLTFSTFGKIGSDWVHRRHPYVLGANLGTFSFADILDGAIRESKLANNSVTVNKIANFSVTTDKLATNAVTGTKILDLTITATKLAAGSVINSKIADGQVTNSKIANNNVFTEKLADFAVNAQKMATNAVTTVKIADGAVTAAKTAFASAAWRQHNGALQALQRDFTPAVAKSSEPWTLYRIDYTLSASATFTPLNTPNLEAYAIAFGATGDVGRWWSNRLVVNSAVLPTQSPDLYIFPQDINFLNPAGSGSFFVAAKAGSGIEASLLSGTLELRTLGYSLSWITRVHSYTANALGEVSPQEVSGAGGGGGLLYFDEDAQTLGGVTYSVLQALATSDTTAGLALMPKSEFGPIVANLGGDARGVGAIDFQRSRLLTTDVASGAYSGLFAGLQNRASGARSVVIGGRNNHAATSDSAVLGRQGQSRNSTEVVISGHGFDDIQGTSQSSIVVLRSNGDVPVTAWDQFIPVYFGSGSSGEVFTLAEGEVLMMECLVVLTVKEPSSTLHVRSCAARLSVAYGDVRSQAGVNLIPDVGVPNCSLHYDMDTDTLSLKIQQNVYSPGDPIPTDTTARATVQARYVRHRGKLT